MSEDSLKNRVIADMKQAMKDKKPDIVQALKLIYAEWKNKEIDLKQSLNQLQLVAVLKKQIKQYQESIAQYEQVGRQEEAEVQKKRLDAVQFYLPKSLSDEELKSIIETSIQQNKPESLKQMGVIIKDVQARTSGSADNHRLVELVKERLQDL